MSKQKLQATVMIKRLPKRSMMNLHTELGHAEFDGLKVRFCQHINGACFWLSVGPVSDPNLNKTVTYQVDTEELMNSVLNVVMASRGKTGK